jgi:hypothetical protein
MAKKSKKKVAIRDQHGRFVKGASGNPEGRPAGTRNHIKQLQQDTEHALRDYLATPANQVRAMKGIDRIFHIMEHGGEKEAVSAFKVLFDRILPNVKQQEEGESKGQQRPVVLQIVNHTGDNAPPVRVIDGDYEDVSDK